VKLAVIGTGYVGLVSGTCFSEFGHSVVCVDKDQEKIKALNDGHVPIYEPGLQELVTKNAAEGRLRFTSDTAEAVGSADAVFIAVGTPSSRRGDGYSDLSFVFSAAEEVAEHITGYTVIVDKSTVPVGTARRVARMIQDKNPGADFDVVSNPEFLREGAALGDFMRPDRVVIGAESERAIEVMKEIYKPTYLLECPFVITGLESAELVKYASNAFLAAKMSFVNEMSVLCEAVGADISEVAHGIGLDGRIGKKFLHAGPGYGGSCLPKDTKALLRVAQEHGSTLRIIESAVEVNEAQKARMVHKIQKALGGDPVGKVVGVFGLSFKPETDDLRDSPALTILPRLQEMGVHLKAHDPASMDMAKKLLLGVEFVTSPYEAAEGADAVVLMTEWNQYRALDFARLKDVMTSPVFVDLRNVYEPVVMQNLGFRYYSVGR
jgi:UDPglucose 6-dehydrogenase